MKSRAWSRETIQFHSFTRHVHLDVRQFGRIGSLILFTKHSFTQFLVCPQQHLTGHFRFLFNAHQTKLKNYNKKNRKFVPFDKKQRFQFNSIHLNVEDQRTNEQLLFQSIQPLLLAMKNTDNFCNQNFLKCDVFTWNTFTNRFVIESHLIPSCRLWTTMNVSYTSWTLSFLSHEWTFHQIILKCIHTNSTYRSARIIWLINRQVNRNLAQLLINSQKKKLVCSHWDVPFVLTLIYLLLFI